MKKIFFLGCILCAISFQQLFAQVTGSFQVKGDEHTYYPVSFTDGAYNSNIATVLQLGRPYVHQDSTWRGSFIAQFRYHCNDWGNGADFIDADLRQHENGPVVITNFIGGWQDVTYTNSTACIVIWLRGGTTTYYYSSNYAVNPVIYDGVQNALPYQIVNGGTLTSKTVADKYVDSIGANVGDPVYATNFSVVGSSGLNQVDINNDLNSQYQFIAGGSASGSPFAGKLMIRYSNYLTNAARLVIDSLGNVGIGTTSPQSLFSVEGTITAKQINVTQTGWSDFVFDSTYRLMPLNLVDQFIQNKRHLPDIPSAAALAKSGLDVGTMQKLHMQKIEELTLYAIEADRKIRQLDSTNIRQQVLLEQLQAQLQKQQGELDKLKENSKKN